MSLLVELPTRSPFDDSGIGGWLQSLGRSLRKIFRFSPTWVPVGSVGAIPFSAICQLEINFGGIVQYGTGVRMNDHLILTAGHNIVFNEVHGTASTIAVRQARNGSSAPGTPILWSAFDVHPGWAASEGKNDATDLGALLLPAGSVNPSVNINYAVPENSLLDRLKQTNGERINVAGFPQDLDSGKDGNTMWHDHGPVADRLPKKILYRIEATGGNSGSPVYYSNAGGGGGSETHLGTLIGVHVGLGAASNIAVRIDSEISNLIAHWLTGNKITDGALVAGPIA